MRQRESSRGSALGRAAPNTANTGPVSKTVPNRKKRNSGQDAESIWREVVRSLANVKVIARICASVGGPVPPPLNQRLHRPKHSGSASVEGPQQIKVEFLDSAHQNRTRVNSFETSI